MEQEILKFFMKKGFLLDNEMLDFFGELKDKEIADKILERVKVISGERLITKSLVDKNLNKIQDVFSSLESDKKKVVERFFVNFNLQIEIKKEKYGLETAEEIQAAEGAETTQATDMMQATKTIQEAADHLRISSPNISPPQKLDVNDFVKHFRNRYTDMKNVLQERSELQNLTSVDKIEGHKQNISVIVIISDKRVTKNKNILLEIEDLTGKAVALINQNKQELYERGKDIILDEVIGLKCSGSREMLFVNDIVYPDATIQEKKKATQERYALFSSDMHVGSNKFLEENFLRFVDWVNGKINHKEEVKKIKYLFFTGDNVDGVGIFPGQENHLKIKDIKEQYGKLAELLGLIRRDIRIIMCPGQHDAVRVAEPQPAIDENYAPDLYKLDNISFVTNPCCVQLQEGYEVLMYHGGSFHGVIGDIESLRMSNPYDKPTLVVKELLKRRHLAPTHSSVVYIPGERDPLLIRKIPDIITTGEVHRLDVDTYNNILMIANSCWQTQTPYEEKVGNHPDPCKVPMLNLKTREIKILDFS